MWLQPCALLLLAVASAHAAALPQDPANQLAAAAPASAAAPLPPPHEWPKSFDAFLRTYKKDAEFFEYAIRSFKKFGTPFRNLVVLCPQGDGNIFRDILLRNGVNNSVVHEKVEILAKGYDEQMMDKLMPDIYTDAEYLCMLDSDSILAHPMKYEEFFKDGKPLHTYRDRVKCGEACHSHMKNCAAMIGEVDKDNEFMTRLGQVYPRESFKWVRDFVQQKYGIEMTSWLKQKSDETKDIVSHTGAYFSEFESLGVILFHLHRDAVNWCKFGEDPGCDGFAPWPPIMQGWSHDTPERNHESQAYFQCAIDKGEREQECVDRKYKLDNPPKNAEERKEEEKKTETSVVTLDGVPDLGSTISSFEKICSAPSKHVDTKRSSKAELQLLTPQPWNSSLCAVSKEISWTPSFKMCLWDNGETISKQITDTGLWDEHDTKTFSELFASDKPGYFVDVGANLGYFSLLAAAHGRKVIAFEPHPGNYARFQQSIQANGFQDRISLYRNGLSDTPGLGSMFTPPDNKGMARLSHEFNVGYPSEGSDIPIVRLDDVGMPADIVLMKVDVEGFETRFFKGAQNNINRVHNTILEYTPSEYPKDGCDGDMLIDALLGSGLKLTDTFGGRQWSAQEVADLKTKAKQADFSQTDLVFSRPTPKMGVEMQSAMNVVNLQEMPISDVPQPSS